MSVTETTTQLTYNYVKSKTKDELWFIIDILCKNNVTLEKKNTRLNELLNLERIK